jgi:hypothetical protein
LEAQGETLFTTLIGQDKFDERKKALLDFLQANFEKLPTISKFEYWNMSFLETLKISFESQY